MTVRCQSTQKNKFYRSCLDNILNLLYKKKEFLVRELYLTLFNWHKLCCSCKTTLLNLKFIDFSFGTIHLFLPISNAIKDKMFRTNRKFWSLKLNYLSCWDIQRTLKILLFFYSRVPRRLNPNTHLRSTFLLRMYEKSRCVPPFEKKKKNVENLKPIHSNKIKIY